MLVRLVMITLCVAWTAAELQCPGPGRYSTTPGTCTSEYYTCNRDVNKEYIAYVLSCPGNTLFNERTRKCSSAKAVSCIPPSHTTPAGQIKLATSRRQMTTQQTSSWISRPSYGYKFTTRKPQVEYRKPGRLPWVTARPYFESTSPMTTKTKPPKNQWRIRTSTTRRTSLAPATKHFVLPAKIMIRRTTRTFIRKKETATSKNMANTVHQKTTAPDSDLSTDFVYQQPTRQLVNLLTSAVTSIVAYTSELPTTMLDRDVNAINSTVLHPKSTSPITPMPMQAFTSKNSTPLSHTAASPVHTTVKMKPVIDNPSNVICDQQKATIFSGSATQPATKPTSPQPPNIDNGFETTPEVILRNNNSPIPFIDSLEPNNQNADVEIVKVVYNSSSKNSIKQIEPSDGKQIYTPVKHIRYFYDPDINSAVSQKLVNKIVPSLKMPNKKNQQKIRQKKRRQPK